MPLHHAISGSIRDALLLAACARLPGTIEPVQPPTDVTLGPPIIEQPLYACANHVVVTGARQQAFIDLYVDGQPVDEVQFHGLQAVFTLEDSLEDGQVITATQRLGSVTSDPGSAIVRDHSEDFPDGLPPPVIAPVPLYECATAIAIHNVPGVELTVEKRTSQGTSLHDEETEALHTWFGGLGPAFEIGDRFRVRQRLCNDESDWSAPEFVVAAPSSVEPPTFDPPFFMAGQEVVILDSIVQGAEVWVDEMSFGSAWYNPSVPYNWYPIPSSGNLHEQHALSAGQKLCNATSNPSVPTDVMPCDIEILGHTIVIGPPKAGDTFVVVTESIPGATVRILDATGEIGSGSGFVIGLTRALETREVIGAVQELWGCAGNLAYTIVVQ